MPLARVLRRVGGKIPRRYWFVVLGVLLTGIPPSWAQGSRAFKIGILTTAMSPWHTETEGFREGLKELGYVERQRVTFEARAAQGDVTRLPELVAELVKQSPDLLYCVASPSARACQQATDTIPVVMVGVGDPVRLGLVQSLAQPGRNITGISNLRAELAGKRLELFKEAVPALRRVLVTYDPREPEEREAVASARDPARALGVSLIEHAITAPLEIEPALATLNEGGHDGILIVQSGLNLNIPGRSLEVATSKKLPTMYPHSFWSKFGALASYGPDQDAQGRQAARLAHRILTGTPPRELPVELPNRIEFIVNLKTAKQLGLQVPQMILRRADRLIE